MKMADVIHLVLARNNIALLNALSKIYQQTADLANGFLPLPAFSCELADYVFSPPCTFQLCL